MSVGARLSGTRFFKGFVPARALISGRRLAGLAVSEIQYLNEKNSGE